MTSVNGRRIIKSNFARSKRIELYFSKKYAISGDFNCKDASTSQQDIFLTSFWSGGLICKQKFPLERRRTFRAFSDVRVPKVRSMLVKHDTTQLYVNGVWVAKVKLVLLKHDTTQLYFNGVRLIKVRSMLPKHDTTLLYVTAPSQLDYCLKT